MAHAVVGVAKMGQLAQAKYMWEMAGIYPPITDLSRSTSEEDTLAKTLLERLKSSDRAPVKLDEEDEPATVVVPAKKALGEGDSPVDQETKSDHLEGH